MTIKGQFQYEFDCTGCGRHIIRFTGPSDEVLCGFCQTMPGWFRDPELRKRLDPDNDGREKEKHGEA